jgi:ketosteroid isomerase-like protein
MILSLIRQLTCNDKDQANITIDKSYLGEGQMIKNLILAFALLLVVPVLTGQSDKTTLGEEIRKLDMAHAAAIFKGDAAALDSLMDDDVTVNHPTNRIVKEKKELLELIRQGVIRYISFERFPETFLFFNDMVVVMGNEIVVPSPGAPNAGKSLQRRYTNVWMKQDGKWRLTVRHANNVCL